MAHEPLIVIAQFDGDDFDEKKIHELLESGNLKDTVDVEDFYKLVPDKYDYVDTYGSEEECNKRMDKIYNNFIEESFRDGTPLLKAVGNGYDRIFTANVEDIAERTMKDNVELAADALKKGKLTTTLYNNIFNPQWSPTVAVCHINKDGFYETNPLGDGPYTTTRKSFLFDEVCSGSLYCVIDAFNTHW